MRELGRDATGLDVEEQLSLLANVLESRGSTLGKSMLLIDDVTPSILKDIVKLATYLPPTTSIMISTRDLNVGVAIGAIQFKLDPLERSHSRKLLERISSSSAVLKEVDSVDQLLTQLGDLPLAVELVSRQIAVRELKPGFSIAAICNRLNEFDQQLLSFPGHREIALSFALSYDNLSDDERFLFRSLGTFASGPLDVSCVAAIAGDLDESVAEMTMDRLVSLSILSWGNSPGDYRIHPLLHKYAEFQLTHTSAVEHKMVRHRHSKFFIDLAKAAAKDMPRGMSLIDRCFGNVSRAIRHASDCRDHKSVVETVMFLVIEARFFVTLNLDNESIPLLELSIESAKAIRDLDAESAQRGHLASAFSRTGMIDSAVTQYEQAIILSRKTGNDYDLAAHLQNLGCTLISEAANYNKAEKMLYEGLEVAQRSYNSDAAIGCLSSLASLHRQMGNLQSAADLYSKALASARLFKNRLAEGNNLSNLGLVVDQLGNIVEAERMIREALAIAVEIGDKRGEGNRIGHLGGLLFAKAMNLPSGVERFRALESARKHCSLARDIAQATNDFEKSACWMMNLALIAALEGRISECIKRLEEVLGLIQGRGYGLLEAQVHYNLGDMLDRCGQIESALAHFHKSCVTLKCMGSPMASRTEEHIRRLNATLSSIKHK